jgi:hypothetical protein
MPECERKRAEAEKQELLESSFVRLSDEAILAVDRVRKALHRLKNALLVAENDKAQPDKVLRAFGGHLNEFIIVPSARYVKKGRQRNTARTPGCFTYEPPHGVVWTDG